VEHYSAVSINIVHPYLLAFLYMKTASANLEQKLLKVNLQDTIIISNEIYDSYFKILIKDCG